MRVLLPALLLFCLPVSIIPVRILPHSMLSAKEAATLETTALPVTEPEKVGMSAKILAEAPQALQKLVDDGKVAGVIVMVARKGKVVLHEAIGYADIEADKPMQTDSVIRIYSMSKPITSTCVMMLVEQGRIALDDPVSKYIPELAKPQVYVSGDGDDVELEPADREVTVRDLLRHTSGYTYGFFGNTYVDKQYLRSSVLFPTADLQATVAKIGKLPLLNQPGTEFHYSVSTDVLGRLIEVVSGQTLDQYFAEKVFEPLRMNDTGFFVKEANHSRLVNNYEPASDKKGLKVRDAAASSRYLSRPKLFSGGGGLVSTSGDYVRFCQMLLNKGELEGARLLKPESIEVMSQNQLPESSPTISMQGLKRLGVGFGLGFSVVTDKVSGSPLVPLGELGWGGAASTHFWISPKDELAVVVMTQRMPFSFQAEAIVKPIVYRAIENRK